MTNAAEPEINNYVLYKFIQLAFEHVHQKIRIDGPPMPIVDTLHRRWMEHMLGLPIGELINASDSTADLTARPGAQRRILSGNAGDFRPDAQAIAEHARRREEHITHFNDDCPKFKDFGLEAYATYWPIHFFYEGTQFDIDWGVYISEEGITRLAAVLEETCISKFGPPHSMTSRPSTNEQDDSQLPPSISFYELAYQILLRHELQHFKVEAFALNAELVLSKALYVPYLTHVYAETYPAISCLEEALANATVLNSTAIAKRFKRLYPQREPNEFRNIIIDKFFRHQPPCYQNYYLSEGPANNKRRLDGISLHQRATNDLCNQILQGQITSSSERIPFFAFPPDNYFLRAERLVPVHIVSSLEASSVFIPTPPKIREWKRFIQELGYRLDRTQGSHQTWERPGLEPLTINCHGDELGPRAFSSSLANWDLTQPQFRKYFEQYRATKTVPEGLRQHLNQIEYKRMRTGYG